MSERNTNLVPQGRNQIAATVNEFETGLTRYLEDLGLPADNVLVKVSERSKVLGNVPAITDDLFRIRKRMQQGRTSEARFPGRKWSVLLQYFSRDQ